MKHLLLIAMLFIGNSFWAHSSSPIKLSVVRQNTGKIVKSVTLDITSISANIESNYIQIDFSFIPNDILITIHDQNGALIYQETAYPGNTRRSIDISTWIENDYTISFTDPNNTCIMGQFSIE